MTHQKLEQIKQIVVELEAKSELTKSEKFKLARYLVILRDPKKHSERYEKMKNTVSNKSIEEKTRNKTKTIKFIKNILGRFKKR